MQAGRLVAGFSLASCQLTGCCLGGWQSTRGQLPTASWLPRLASCWLGGCKLIGCRLADCVDWPVVG